MTDDQLQEHVKKALDWVPTVDASGIDVSVDRGVVRLRGDVRTRMEQVAAERVAFLVDGVRAVANDVKLRMTPEGSARIPTSHRWSVLR
jgi:osmotically-inducible protein OsmY